MAIFAVELPASRPGAHTATALVISAANATDAKEMAKAHFSGAPEQAWETATATQLADVASNAANALVGWRFRVVVSHPTTGVIVADAEATGDATNDTLDEVLTAVSTALDADGLTSTYTGATQTLEIAAAGDAKGDHKVNIYIRPPAANDGADLVNLAGYVSSITDEGAAGAALTAVFAADTLVVPTILKAFGPRL